MKILAAVQILSEDTRIEFCSKENAILSTGDCSFGILMKILAVAQTPAGHENELCSKGNTRFKKKRLQPTIPC